MAMDVTGTVHRRRVGVWQWVTLGSIGAAVTLFALGKKNLAIMVGMAPSMTSALRNR